MSTQNICRISNSDFASPVSSKKSTTMIDVLRTLGLFLAAAMVVFGLGIVAGSDSYEDIRYFYNAGAGITLAMAGGLIFSILN